VIVVASIRDSGYLNPPNGVVTVRCLVVPPGRGSFHFLKSTPRGEIQLPRGVGLYLVNAIYPGGIYPGRPSSDAKKKRKGPRVAIAQVMQSFIYAGRRAVGVRFIRGEVLLLKSCFMSTIFFSPFSARCRESRDFWYVQDGFQRNAPCKKNGSTAVTFTFAFALLFQRKLTSTKSQPPGV